MADVNDTTQSGEEPSMEEILASIRKIIADDNAPEEQATKEAEDIIDLTQMMQEDGSVVDIGQTVHDPDDIDIMDREEDIVVPPPAAALTETYVEQLVSEPAVEAAASSIAALTNTLEIERLSLGPQSATFIGNGTRTLEDMVLELMRPMLKDWLDKNLPGTVERLVQKEVERISRRAKD